jgi:GDP-L-fucose synthase
MSLDRSARIYVAGHRGLAGSAIVRQLTAQRHDHIIVRNHAELDLEDATAARHFFEQQRPEVVFMAAARAGGILANSTEPVSFLMRNLKIQANVIEAAHAVGVRRMIFLGSSCIYPRDCPQPIREEYLLTGPLEATNRSYALAKIAGIEMCWSYNRQYGTGYLAAMPTNLYGPGDNYDLRSSHVAAALIRKMHEAQSAGAPSITIWGSGTPRREFLHSDDLGRALVFLASLDDVRYKALTLASVCPLINVGSGTEQSISELAQMVARVVGFRGEFVYDSSMPDGTPRKVMDVSRMRALGWEAKMGLAEGLASAYRDFLETATRRPHSERPL